MPINRRRVALAALAALAAAPVMAQFPSRVPAEARLLAGWALEPGVRSAGLEIALEPGWKTYWRAPGEAGIPPVFDWSGSENLAAAEVLWPAPALFDSFGLTTIGYDGRVVLPLTVTADNPDAPVRLRLTMDYGVCAEICIPARAELALDLPPGAPEAGRAAIEAALARLPVDSAAAGVASAECALRGAGPQRAFEARLDFEPVHADPPHVVIEGPEGVWFAPAAARFDGAALEIAAEAEIWSDAAWIAREDLRLTLLFDGWAADLPGCGG
jgi:DsbC/DsbD-like thiol-disulfide interchange protein